MTGLWIAPLLAFLVALPGVGALWRLLVRLRLEVVPVERSLHSLPTPAGAGIVLVPIATGTLVVTEAISGVRVGLPALLLCLVGAWDDLREVGVLPRLGVQILAAAWVLSDPSYPPESRGTAVLAFFAVIAWVNVFNFMDGLDGLAATELITTCGALAGLSLLSGRPALGSSLLVLVAVAAAFLFWNRPPAKIFLGDSGSVPLAFLFAALAREVVRTDLWIPLLLLLSVFFADAGLTFARRLFRGDKVWLPHREHFYQRAVARGSSQRRVLSVFLAAKLVLAIQAWCAWSRPELLLLPTTLGGATVAAVLAWMGTGKGRIR